MMKEISVELDIKKREVGNIEKREPAPKLTKAIPRIHSLSYFLTHLKKFLD